MKNLFIKYLPSIIIVGAISLFYLPNLLQNKIPIPTDGLIGLYHPWRDIELDGYNTEKYPVKNPLITDPFLQTYPWRKVVIENLKAMQLPLWNPYSFAGQPLAANIQSGAFNPVNLLFLLIPFNLAWSLQVLIGSLSASIFMYVFLRKLRISSVASLYGAIAYPFSAFFVSWLTWGTIHLTAALLPFILYLLTNLSIKIKTKYFILLILALVCVFLTGHTQTAIYVIFAASIYAAFNSYKNKSLKILAVFTLCLTLSFMIVAPQILSSLEFLNHSNRSVDQQFFNQKEDWFLPYKHIAQLIAPDFFGNPTKGNYWGIWNYGEFVSFVGITPLFFAIFALLKLRKKTMFYILLLFISVVAAIKNPLSLLPYQLKIPVISSMQPSRAIFLIDFSLIVLATYGFDYFRQKKNILKPFLLITFIFLTIYATLFLYANSLTENIVQAISTKNIAIKNLIVPLTTFLLAILISAYFKIKNNDRIFLISIFLLTILELFYFASRYTPFSNSSTLYPPTKIISFLMTQEKPFRVLSTNRRIANPNSLTAYRIESVSGYDPLYLKKYAEFVSAWQENDTRSESNFNRFITPEKFNSQLTNLINVKFILTFDEINSPGFEKIMQEGKTILYENKNASNRVVPLESVTKLDGKDILNELRKTQNLNIKAYSSDFEIKDGDLNAVVKITKYTDQELTFDVQSRTQTPILISNVNYPGWKAFIDNQQTEIKNIDYLFQSVLTPPGEHKINLKFESETFEKGLLVSGIGLLFTILASAFIWRNYR